MSRALSHVATRAAVPLGRDNLAHVLVVDASDGAIAVPQTLRRTQEAIALLHQHSEVHLRWLKRSVNQIVLVPAMHSAAAFERITRSVYLSTEIGTRYDAVAIAAAIVHETTHARAAALGLRVSTRQRALQQRLERRCVTEQLSALLRIDPDHPSVGWSRELLETRSADLLVPSAADRRAISQRIYRRVRSAGHARWIGRCAVKVGIWLGGK